MSLPLSGKIMYYAYHSLLSMYKFNISLSLLLLPKLVIADHGSISLGTGSASPIATETAITLPQGEWSLGLRTEYSRLDSFSDSRLQELRAEDAEADLHSVRSLWTYSAGLSYGITDDLTVGFKIPFIYRNNIREPEHDHVGPGAEIEDLGDVEGIGDASFFGQYRFFNQENTHASVILGLKAPTGKTSRSVPGEILETEFQPGSGSWDGLFGLAFTRQIDAFSFDSSFVYNLSSEGIQNTDLGDVFSYNFATSYNILGTNDLSLANSPIKLDLIMEINGEWRDREEVNGIEDNNSGGNLVFLSPGIKIHTTEASSFAVSLGVPVVQDTNGNQDEPDYRIIGNFNIGF